MKHQQVVVDYWSMVKSSATCILLAFSGYILLKMVQTIFWLPSHLKKNQKRLEELAAQYKIDLNNPLDDENGLATISDTDEVADERVKEDGKEKLAIEKVAIENVKDSEEEMETVPKKAEEPLEAKKDK